MITGNQCRAARAMVELTREKLAQLAGVDTDVIEQFERRIKRPDDAIVTRLATTLEKSGIVFIPENGGGAGVRLKFNSSMTRRIGIMEGEGGTVASDDVP